MPSRTDAMCSFRTRRGWPARGRYINGPAKFFALTELPFGSSWHRRIRSMRAGPRATATVWADEGFQGLSLRLAPNTEHLTLSAGLSGRIESLEIACQAQ